MLRNLLIKSSLSTPLFTARSVLKAHVPAFVRLGNMSRNLSSSTKLLVGGKDNDKGVVGNILQAAGEWWLDEIAYCTFGKLNFFVILK